MAYEVLVALGRDIGEHYEGPTTPDLEWPTWIVYLAVPLGSFLMCFRFLQVMVKFAQTGELPSHDHGHVEGIEEGEVTEVGEAIEIAEQREHAHAGLSEGEWKKMHPDADNNTKKEG
jgi:C4-dicarboxylate transporter DctQ subunit